MIFKNANDFWAWRTRQYPYSTKAATTDYVLATGCFDLLHRGHIEFLKIAHEIRGWLAVGVNSDESVRRLKGQDRPLIPQQDRVYVLDSLSCVQAVFLFDEDTVVETLKATKPPWWAKGGDWNQETMNQEELKTAHEIGTRLIIIPRIGDYSTTSLQEKLKHTTNST